MLTLGLNALSASAGMHGRSLSYAQILSYSPGSQVTDHANIDLDQKAMETELKASDYATAKAIYSTGAHSKPSAVCTLVSPTALGAAVAKKAKISFTTNNGDTPSGKAYAAYAATDTAITFTYPVSDSQVQDPTTTCYVGGMAAADQKVNGCIATGTGSGTAAGDSQFTIDGISGTFTATCVNRGKRTLQGFSTGAQAKMYDCPSDTTKTYANGCPYTSYKPYYDYYGDYSYADSLVTAAFDKTATPTTWTNGKQDFTAGDGATDSARVEFIKKGTAYMHAWMYVIREYEDAIDDCTNGDLTANAGSSGPVHAWDEGVAFFVGSMLKPEDITTASISALDDKGKLAYTLGNKRCQNYKTCGPSGGDKYGEAMANSKLMDLFHAGQHKLLVGKCGDVVPIKDEIVSQMTVPLVQGTLRYAYKVAALSGGAKEKGEGAIFAAAVLPQLHACEPAAATTVYNAMNINSGTPTAADYMAVKAAFEGCYAKMGITCSDVGGLWNSGTDAYYKDGDADAAPCVDASTSGGLDTGGLVGIIVAAVIAVLALLCVCNLISKEKAGKPLFTPIGGGGKA